MASDNEASCESDPNFAVICAFMEKFGGVCGLASIDFLELQEMLENTQEVPQELIDLHIKLLRKSRKTVSNERWEKAVIKFCHGFCVQDAWEIERFGYKKARLSSKLRVLKELLEMQFDYNARFKAEINKMSAEELRSQPLGKDKQGHAYWFQNDNNCQIRVYKEDPDEETWTLVAKDREGLVALISELSNGESTLASSEAAMNLEEDSNSLAEKPIIDTGQLDSPSSDSNKKSESDISDESKKDESDVGSEKKDDDISSGGEDAGNKRAAHEEIADDAKRAKVVSEAIEEPVLVVRGEGEGEANEGVDAGPIVGEAIEEDLMFVYGCGSGEDCGTGNEDNKSSSETKKCEESGENNAARRDASDSDSYVSISVSKNCVNDGSSKEVPTSPPPPSVKSNPYKLGTIIDTKTDNKFFNTIRSPATTKRSRWDVETIIAKDPEPEPPPPVTPEKKSMFFFGPGCMQFKPVNLSPTVAFGQKVPLTLTELGEKLETSKSEERDVMPSNIKGDIGYRISDVIECVQSAGKKIEETPIGSKLEEIEETKAEDEDRAANKAESEDVVHENEDADRKNEDVPIIVGENEDTDGKNEDIPIVVDKNEDAGGKNEDVPIIADKNEDTGGKNEDILIVVDKNEDAGGKNEDNPIIVDKNEDTGGKNEDIPIIGDKNEDTGSKNEDIESEPEPVLPENEDIPAENEVSDDEDNAAPFENEDVASENEDTTTENEEIPAESEEILPENKIEDAPTGNEIISNEDKRTENEEVVSKSEDKIEETVEGPAEIEDSTTKNEDILPATKIEDKAPENEDVSSETKIEDKAPENEDISSETKIEDKAAGNGDISSEAKDKAENKNEEIEEELSKQIVSETDDPPTKPEEIPSVTAALIDYPVPPAASTKEESEETEETACVKKESYLLGDEKIEESKSKPRKNNRRKTEEKSPPVLKDETQAVAPRRGRSRGIQKLDEDDKAKKEENEDLPPPVLIEAVTVESSSSSDLVELPDRDPLAVSENEEKEEGGKKPMSLANFSLDFVEEEPTKPLTRSGLRKRSRESPQKEEVEASAGKRMKKAKRNVDVKLRKSIEEQKKQELISSDDDKADKQKEESEDKAAKKKQHKKVEESSDVEKEAEPKPKKNKTHKDKRLRLLASLGIDPDQVEALNFGEEGTGRVRQSRRIAQLKIKEEAERRKLEEELVHEQHKKKKSKKSEDKDYKVEKKKLKNDDDGEESVEEDSADSKKKKKKKKKRKHKKLFDEFNPWRSSSDSSTTDEEDEEEMGEEEEDEELQYVSDHEFSPESDLEGDGEALPLKRARTARKESDVEEVDDCPCQKCGKSDHPEWILLCDRCDNGWHCSCLRPPLLVIPEGDWFCPPCQHVTLLNKLQEKLQEYDTKLSKKEIEDRRKQRLAYVGISLNSVLPEGVKKRRRNSQGDDDAGDDDDDGKDADADDDDDDDEESSSGDESGSVSGSDSGSDSDEPIYQLRQRRQAHSYRFNDYDELINSAIQEEMEAVKGAGNQGRGKDISTIVNAEKEEMQEKGDEAAAPNDQQEAAETLEPEPLPPVVPLDDRDKEPKPVYSDDEPIRGVRKKIVGRKKHRKLNSLDISSEDDNEDSDEDFKGTSSESDDDFDDDLGSEDSEVLDGGRGRRRGNDPVRRSTRARTSRYDADFIDDGETEDEDSAPRRKKKRSIWDESESEESDRSWGRRKRKPASKQKKPSSNPASKKKKTKKKKKENDDSDAEVYRKKKPKIKFGGLDDAEGPGRRTRGKKINYVDALGSDSDEDRVKRPVPRIESEEEYVANEEDDFDEEDKASDEEEADSASESKAKAAAPKVQIQSYADARFTQLLPEGVPTPKDLYSKNPVLEDGDGELNPIDQINRNVEMMDENEMEKMMEDEEYANKHLQMVALQLEKEKRRKEREAKAKLEGLLTQQVPPISDPKKRGRKPKNQFFGGAIQEPIIGNVDGLIVNAENNDELSEPPGVSLPLFAELGSSNDGLDDSAKKRRGRSKKSLEEAVANLGSARQQQESQSAGFGAMPQANQKLLPTDLSVVQQQQESSNIEIAAPPQPFSQSQPTPSVITRMLQSKPGQPGYPIGAIRPKQFAAMPEREDGDVATLAPAPAHHGQYLQGAGLRPPPLSSPYRQLPPMNHYPRGTPPPHQIRAPVPHMYHSHRPLDPSPSGGGSITMPPEHSSPGRVVSPAAGSPNKTETPPPPYSRPPPVARFPLGPRHLPMVAHLQHPRPTNLSPYHPSMPPSYHYGQFGQLGEEAMPPTVYQNSPYPAEQFGEGQVGQENSNSKSFDEESGGEFGGLVSYFSSQREDDLES